MFYVYTLARPDNTVFYVGKGTSKRIFQHDYEARGDCKCHKCNVIRKIWKQGKQIQRYFVFTTENEDEAFTYERELIALYGRDNLCNQTDGGEGQSGRIFSLEERAKLKARWANPEYRANQVAKHKLPRGYSPSKETRKKIGDAQRGKRRKPLTVEHRARLIEANRGSKRLLGFKASDATREKHRQAMLGNTRTLGMKHSEETKRKMSEARKGNTNALGTVHSETTKQKMSEAQKRLPPRQYNRVYELIDPTGLHHTCTNLSQFCRDHVLNVATIHSVVCGRRASAFGWTGRILKK